MKGMVRGMLVLMAVLMIKSSCVYAETAVVPLMKYGGDTNWINLNIYGLNVRSGATHETGFGQHSGISLPDSGTPSIDVSLTVPPNFKPGTELSARILWHIDDTNCGVVFRQNFLSVTRDGSAPLLGSGASSGLEVVGGTTLSADPSNSNVSQEVVVKISSPDSGESLQPLDVVNFGMFRSSTAPSDTCSAEMMVSGVMVTYETP